MDILFIQRLIAIQDEIGYSPDDAVADRQTVNNFGRNIGVRYIVVHAHHRDTPLHEYILNVSHGCIETISDDEMEIVYYIEYPFKPSGLVSLPQ